MPLLRSRRPREQDGEQFRLSFARAVAQPGKDSSSCDSVSIRPTFTDRAAPLQAVRGAEQGGQRSARLLARKRLLFQRQPVAISAATLLFQFLQERRRSAASPASLDPLRTSFPREEFKLTAQRVEILGGLFGLARGGQASAANLVRLVIAC